jgi:class 3 adenylate cyclase
MNPGKDGGGARQLGYFPDDALERINTVQRLKRDGIYMSDIVNQMTDRIVETQGSAEKEAAVVSPAARREPETASISYLSGRTRDGDALSLTIEQIPHPAYMVNHNFEVVWFNQAARDDVLGGFEALPPNVAGRSVLQLMCKSPEIAARNAGLLRFHMSLAKGRLSHTAISRLCEDLPAPCATLLESSYADAEPVPKQTILDAPLSLTKADGSTQSYRAYASFFREGILLVYARADRDDETLSGFLARRDEVIHNLLRKRLPVLTPLAVSVAELQNSAKICSELPAEEYFELINEIRAATAPVFRKYYATRGKQIGDGMVCYFLPQPDSHYILNALLCAQEIKIEIRKISKAWQLRKNWLNELYLNVGIDEGEQWLGTFESATSIEFAVLGDTVEHAARLSTLGRHGGIWLTKNVIGRLSAQERARVRYGITRRTADGRDVFVGSSYSALSGLIDLNDGQFEKFRVVAALAATEMIEVTPAA